MTLHAVDPTVGRAASQVVRIGNPASSMSLRLWDLDWSKLLPWTIGDVTIEHGTFDAVLPFVKENYARLFGTADGRFVVEETTQAKLRFLAEADVFIFRRAGQTVGYGSGHPSDWSTYYFRTLAILPEFRQARFGSEFSRRICDALASTAADRLEVETSIANVPMTKILLELGFVVTATSISERWGTMLRLTKHFREDAKQVFQRQYVYVPELGRGDPNTNRRGP